MFIIFCCITFVRALLVLTLLLLISAMAGVLRFWQCQGGNGNLQDSGGRGSSWLRLSRVHSYGS